MARTLRQKAALRKAQLASARKRRRARTNSLSNMKARRKARTPAQKRAIRKGLRKSVAKPLAKAFAYELGKAGVLRKVAKKNPMLASGLYFGSSVAELGYASYQLRKGAKRSKRKKK